MKRTQNRVFRLTDGVPLVTYKVSRSLSCVGCDLRSTRVEGRGGGDSITLEGPVTVFWKFPRDGRSISGFRDGIVPSVSVVDKVGVTGNVGSPRDSSPVVPEEAIASIGIQTPYGQVEVVGHVPDRVSFTIHLKHVTYLFSVETLCLCLWNVQSNHLKTSNQPK